MDVPPDLTEDTRTGIGKRSIEEIVRYFKTGAFGWNLDDREIADVLTYVRNAWGDVASAVQPDDVTKLRGRLQQ